MAERARQIMIPQNMMLWMERMPIPKRRLAGRMASLKEWLWIFIATIAVFEMTMSGAETPGRAPRDWQPVADEVYLQETGRKVLSQKPLTSVAVLEGKVYAGTASGLLELDGNELRPVSGAAFPVKRLVVAADRLWVLAGDRLLSFGNRAWTTVSDQPVDDLCAHQDYIVAARGSHLWRIQSEGLRPLAETEAPFSIQRVVSWNETIYVEGSGRVTVFNGKDFGGRNVFDDKVDRAWDWGSLPSLVIRDTLAVGNRLFFGTDHGLALLRGMALSAIGGQQGLCYEDTTCLARGFTNDVWVGTSRGAIRMAGGRFDYFAGRRWLPDEQVVGIAAGDRSVYIATPKGLGIIEYEPFTLLKKAAFYERHLKEWGQKRLGFVHKLEWDETVKEFVREVSDNDGGYSGDFLAAQSYRFAVTKDPEARREAVNTFQSLRWLGLMTGVPGFPARAVWAKGERGHQSDAGPNHQPSKWHDTADGKFEWKGDTSSDELCSHFYSTSIFLELAAQGEEIAQAKAHLAGIADHLINHGWKLVDVTGRPTRWGRWDPDYFNSDEGRFDRGLQSLEMLSFMKTAGSLTGESRFRDAYHKLVDLGYPANTLRERAVFPPEDILHFEDELAFWAYWNLLRRETEDGALRSVYRRSFERTWEILRIEQQPWFNFLYGAVTGSDCDIPAAVRELRDWPVDLVVWSYQNSHRADLRPPPGYTVFKAGIRPFPPRETEPMRWDHWTMQADGGAGGRDVAEPSGWLLAYWMGRYYGFIEPPSTTDARMVSVPPGDGAAQGARPYTGPPRPANLQPASGRQ